MIPDDILNKMRRYCAYQERCHEEVRTKLLSLKIYGADLEETINALIGEDFLNEERFALAFAGGKFRIKQWGKVKIAHALKAKKISPYCIRKALAGISESDYNKTLLKLIVDSKKKYKSKNTFEQSGKIANYLKGKGYESGKVWALLKDE